MHFVSFSTHVAFLLLSLATTRSNSSELVNYETQDPAPWHLQMISNREPGYFHSPYRYEESGGAGVYVYVLDGGYDLKHDEVADRITYGRSIVLNGCDGLPNYKHGTSVASAIIGKTVGVAKNATVIGVEAGTMDSRFCHGWVAMQRALFWTINDIYLRKREERSVVNISWSDKHPKGCKLINFFVDQLHLMGVSVVVAAGNYETDDINRCPLNSSTAITVASMDMFMSISPFSNYGPAIDLFAPGGHLDLARAFYRNKMREVHGTSYAAPVVAGSIACLISAEGYLPPEEMRQRLLELGTKDALIETRGSPNIIVYNGLGF